MSEPRAVPDLAAREAALDPAGSFIVQAPAGSGKTELLIQRFLALLARVETPEEIVAITFTRKAAGEMRERVVRALRGAESELPPEPDHQRRTWELARAARQRDHAAGWGLNASPARLRIQTIDSLCAALTRQMPLLSGFGGQLEPVEDAAPLYREAARRTLALVEGGESWSGAIGRVLLHLDNHMAKAEGLLAGMLARRDQWLRHVADRRSPQIRRETLEAGLASLSADALESLTEVCPRELEAELAALARYAATNLLEQGRASPVTALVELQGFPGSAHDQLDRWCAIAELLLTRTGSVRRQVNVANGFPPPGAAEDATEQARRAGYIDRMRALLAALVPYDPFLAELHLVRSLPPPRYSPSQWEVVEALVEVLPVAVAQLELLLRERAQVDFAMVSQAAIRALGTPDEPTDLALALDYRIRHLLVDEFQDTSHTQYQLLERLTAGWVRGDGRTLFLVGDPMQSIYRFRHADVALYLRARREGVGTVALQPLALSANFRSQAGIVAWVNQTFSTLLPRSEDAGTGAVPYAHSEAVHDALPDDAVTVHALLGRDHDAEAREVVRLVRAALAEDAAQRIAILVRSRTHLAAIVPALRQAGLRYRAIEIEGLGHRALVSDLHALTRALLHPADRIAWLAVLRAPWCGLTLADLDALAGHDARACLWDLMQRESVTERMTPDGCNRLWRLRDALRPFFAQRRREPLRRWVEGAWLALGGPAAAEDGGDLADAEVFLALLDELDEGSDLSDFQALEERVAGLFALPDPLAPETLQVMTIHKAKGLEFDTVILPGLGSAPRAGDAQLLLWQERPRRRGGSDLLLAPIREAAAIADPVYDYLKQLDASKSLHEDGRLLYVAATRARRRLHLLGHATVRDGRAQPSARSLLAQLWPAVAAWFERVAAAAQAHAAVVPEGRATPETVLRRVPAHWAPPPPAASVAQAERWAEQGGAMEQVEFSWVSETARHVGTVVHRMLQTVAQDGLQKWDAARVERLRAVFVRDLRLLGVPEPQLASALDRVVHALTSALSDPRARWVLGPHAESASELALTGLIDGRLTDLVIDRTFVDERGVRWIVDYKTGIHEGAGLDGFLDSEQVRYREQLERYASAMRSLDGRAVRVALYFPLLRAWREWEPAEG
jgi:ATP-dependent exoDNAse (exonuclease V) beta subunit